MHSVLLIDQDVFVAQTTSQRLTEAGYRVQFASSGSGGMRRLRDAPWDMTLVDLSLPDCGGQALMDFALRHARSRQVIATSGDDSATAAVDAMRAGAADYVLRPLDPQVVGRAIGRALGAPPDPSSQASWRALNAPMLVGDDPRTTHLLQLVQRVAQTDCDVMVTGASGTGKELIARCIHRASARHNRPFVAINCAAVPKDLIESEMFGHARGAFTGATERRVGKFEAADGGTLFLDEAGEMDLCLQGKLLRAIQEREVTPVGDSRTLHVNVRLISATNQKLDALCAEKLFREDLFWRLNVVPIEVPSLKERPEDILALANHFIIQAAQRHRRHISGLDADAQRAFRAYSWPGNVRELQNLIERTVVLKTGSGAIGLSDLPPQMLGRRGSALVPDFSLPADGLDIDQILAAVETRLTHEALVRAGRNRARAAELLGLKRTTLVERLKKLNLGDDPPA